MGTMSFPFLSTPPDRRCSSTELIDPSEFHSQSADKTALFMSIIFCLHPVYELLVYLADNLKL